MTASHPRTRSTTITTSSRSRRREDAAGFRIASAPITAVLVTKAEQTDVRATQIHVGVVFSGSAPIHLQWYEPKLWMQSARRPHRGHAYRRLRRRSRRPRRRGCGQAASRRGSPPPSEAIDVPVPPASDREYVILVRPIDVAGNVAEPHARRAPSGRRTSSSLAQLLRPVPRATIRFRSRRSPRTPVPCASSRAPETTRTRMTRKWTPLPPGEVLRPSGKPVEAWPIQDRPRRAAASSGPACDTHARITAGCSPPRPCDGGARVRRRRRGDRAQAADLGALTRAPLAPREPASYTVPVTETALPIRQ